MHPLLPYLAILLGLLGVSSSSILFQFTSADPLVAAFYRLAIAALLQAGSLLFSPRGRSPMSCQDVWRCVASGLFLACHFGTWFFSLRLTSITASTVLVSTHPFIVLAYNRLFRGERPAGASLAGVLLAVAGAAVVGWGDLSADSQALLGDALAFLGAVAMAGYLLLGRRLRSSLSTITYSTLTYGTAALLLGMTSLVRGVRLHGYSAADWLVFVALAIFPTLLGHILFNWALRFVPAAVLSVSILGEPVGASLLAWLLWRQVPAAATWIGGSLVLAGTALYLRSSSTARDPSTS